MDAPAVPLRQSAHARISTKVATRLREQIVSTVPMNAIKGAVAEYFDLSLTSASCGEDFCWNSVWGLLNAT
jgi:hypothetical protein